mgnify:CR=1 FL=1
MQPRMDYVKAAPDGYKAMSGLESYVRQCGREHPLLEPVNPQASQINGCAGPL